MSIIDDMQAGNWPTLDPSFTMAPEFIEPENPSDIIKIPGIPPILITVGDSITIAIKIGQVISAILAEGSYIPIIAVLEILIQIILQLLPLFFGRPREEATLNCAQNLLQCKNSAGVMAGNLILRLYQERNIVISDSSAAGQKILGQVVAQFINNLRGQGLPQWIAEDILIFQFTTGADHTGKISKWLNFQADPSTATFGPTGYERVYQIVLQHFLDLGMKESVAEQHTFEKLLKYLPINWLIKVYLGNQPGDPHPGVCAQGYKWDPSFNDGQGACVKYNYKPPPPPPPPVTVGTIGDPEGDEITNDLTTTLGDNTNALIYWIQQLQQQMSDGSSGDSTCCDNVITAIGDITGALNKILGALVATTPDGSGSTLDLTPIVTELTCLCDSLKVISSTPAVNLAPVVDALDAINSTLAKGSPTDVSGIIDQLKRRNDDLQVPEDWKTTLINAGAIPPELTGLIQATTWETVEASAAHLVGYILGVGLADAVAIVNRIFTMVVRPVAGVIWKVLTDLVAGFNLGDGSAINQIASAAKTIVGSLDTAITTIFGGAANLVLEGYESGIEGIDTTTDAGVSQVVRILLGRAFELGMGAHFLATLPELAYFTKNLGLNATAALLAELAGFHEVMIQVHRPFMTAAIGRPANYSFNRKYQTTLPAIGNALTLWARRKMLDSDAHHIADSAGYNRAWQTALFAGAYRPLSARALATLTLDIPFNRASMREILEDNAFSPDHVQTMLDLLEFNSTKNLRNSYIAEAETAYKAGVVSDDEIHQIVIDAGWSDAAWQLVKSKILLQRRVVLASEVEKQVVPLVANGNITADEGLQQLEAAGVQDWYAQLQITLATTKATIHAAKLEAAAERKLELERQRNLTKAAVAEFQRGLIDEAGLTAALALAGLDLTIIASIVAVQDATRTGRLRLIFGQLLLPEDAKILTDRVAAIEGQFKKQLLTLDQARAQLKALSVDGPELDALLARWAAALTAVSKYSYLVDPLTGAKAG